ncbi:hypothetical protein GCM10011609_62230 [Lentzea pudingi]|uniref:PE family protein n=1 Tax=Lentzea pudingi TaxID=1789439 RepID=A0ABQ2IM93_9PSEU|nr:hypothetical protein [Lentzea pudingi]GGN13318.1 hypothetical protein GCM10011609_62230 [Lentzea pudingi]
MLMFDALVPVKTAGSVGKGVGAALGAAAGAAAGAGGGGVAKFSVEPEQAQKMIDGLKEALRELLKLRRASEKLKLSGAPGPDPYSGYATLAMRKTAGAEPGGYQWANDQAVKALEQTIKNIEKALAEYRATDEAASTAMKG